MAIIAELIEQRIIVCPDCKEQLIAEAEQLVCQGCGNEFPVLDGIPVLLSADSVFDKNEVIQQEQSTYFSNRIRENKLKQKIRQNLPALGQDYSAGKVDRLVSEQLRGEGLLGLVIGAGVKPEKMNERFPQVTWVTSDVDLSFKPGMVADVHELPFAPQSVDLIVAEMVLEHVVDATRAAREIQRLLKPDGIVLIKVPFSFPWHGVPIDFYRFSPSGLRMLFRHTDLLMLEQSMGPWGGLAYSLDALLINLTTIRPIRLLLAMLSRILFGWLKLFDYIPRSSRSTLYTAAVIAYVGRHRETMLNERETLNELRTMFGGM